MKIAISRRGPECPSCGEWGFDDWWHDPFIKPAVGSLIVRLKGRLRCHGCGKFFNITQYTDGETHCTMGRAA